MSLTISGDAPNFTSASATTVTGVTTLNASSGVLAVQNGMNGIAKAWVNFQGGNGNTAGTINGSFNVSSVTVNGTGQFTVNFTTAMPFANFVAAGLVNDGTLGTDRYIRTSGLTTTTHVMGVYNGGGSAQSVVAVLLTYSSN